MGSSLGGLVSLAIVQRYPDEFEFAASLSGTFGWGSFAHVGSNDGNDTVIDRVATVSSPRTVLYLDSGGGDGAAHDGAACVDSDGDGIKDDTAAADDNFCETVQLRDTLDARGWTRGTVPALTATGAAAFPRPLAGDLFYVFDAGPSGNGDAAHTESAWRFRSKAFIFPLFSAVEARP
jgi:hypothetical protein